MFSTLFEVHAVLSQRRYHSLVWRNGRITGTKRVLPHYTRFSKCHADFSDVIWTTETVYRRLCGRRFARKTRRWVQRPSARQTCRPWSDWSKRRPPTAVWDRPSRRAVSNTRPSRRRSRTATRDGLGTGTTPVRRFLKNWKYTQYNIVIILSVGIGERTRERDFRFGRISGQTPLWLPRPAAGSPTGR